MFQGPEAILPRKELTADVWWGKKLIFSQVCPAGILKSCNSCRADMKKFSLYIFCQLSSVLPIPLHVYWVSTQALSFYVLYFTVTSPLNFVQCLNWTLDCVIGLCILWILRMPLLPINKTFLFTKICKRVKKLLNSKKHYSIILTNINTNKVLY